MTTRDPQTLAKPEIAARLKQLTQDFLDACGVDANALEKTLKALKTPARRDAFERALSELEHIAHRLSGRGATFGFPAISYTAAKLEDVVARAQTAAPGDHLDPAAINDLAQEVLRCLSDARRAKTT